MKAPTRRALVAALTAVALGAACTGGDNDNDRAGAVTTTRATSTTSSTTRPPVTIPGVPRTTTTIPTELHGGGATLGGTVTGPEGLVSDAVVRVERFVGTQVAGTDVAVAAGSWQLPAVHGGRYRVRAWRVPDLAQTQPDVFFLGADETKTLELRLTRVGDLSANATVEPNPPPVGAQATLVVQLFGGAVDAQGVVKGSSAPSTAMQLVLSGAMVLESPDRTVTDGQGQARFTVRCRDPGAVTATAIVGAAQIPVPMPSCGG